MTNSHQIAWVTAALFIGAPPLFGQEQPDPLRGPAVPQTVARTLVARNLQGDFLPIDGRPENAAIAIMQLDGATRERTRAVGTERAVAIGMLLVERIDTIKEITDANIAGNQARGTELLQGLWFALDGETPARFPLLKQLEGALTPDQSAELKKLVEEYWKAWADWETRGMMEATPERRREAEGRMAFALFQREVGEAYERTLRPYRERLEGLYTALEPTPEQRSAIRDVYIDFIRETRLQPTPEQRRGAVRRIYDLLDEERRARLFDLIVLQVDMGG